MSGRDLLVVTVVAVLGLLAAPAGASRKTVRCTAPEGVTRFNVDLPNTARAIRRGKRLVIVAIGSSSTWGTGASDRAHAYPAQLAAELRLRWPRLNVRVINKGIGGQTTDQMFARFGRDVLPHKPHLVIWQTGSNQVIKRGDLTGYADTIRKGIGRLKAARIDVVLMSPQYAPRVLARPAHLRILDVINTTASDLKVAVFHRFEVMRHWVTSGQHKMGDIVSRDRLHMNDLSYSCIARLLADSLAAAARKAPLPTTENSGPADEPRAGTISR